MDSPPKRAPSPIELARIFIRPGEEEPTVQFYILNSGSAAREKGIKELLQLLKDGVLGLEDMAPIEAALGSALL